MAATSAGRVTKVTKRPKGGTASSRNFHFESFSRRVAKLNITKARRNDANRQDVDQHDTSATASHFGAGLERWRELNLSEKFTDFVEEVESLCESLPQVLHNQETIMDTLIRYLELRDGLSLEPLLDLLTQFAHDLGSRFEGYFARALTMVTSIAATHQDIAVMEWSFTSLAWLFKYLSRLLVPDLRPTFDIMAPLLGKTHHKPHIARFAAEAMSFLVRKAAKNEAALALISRHALRDLLEHEKENPETELYRYGLMALFANAVKGVSNGLDFSAVTVSTVLLRTSHELEFVGLIEGVTVNVIHHTTASTFAPLLKLLTDAVELGDLKADPNYVDLLGELLFAVAGVRKGSRVIDWTVVMTAIHKLYEAQGAHKPSSDTQVSAVEKAAAVAFQYAPLDTVIPRFRSFMEAFSSTASSSAFLSFCTFFSDLGQERFNTLVLPYFFKFITTKSSDQEPQTLNSVFVVKSHGSSLRSVGSGSRTMPTLWSEDICTKVENWPSDEGDLALMNGYMELMDTLPLNEEYSARLSSALLHAVQYETDTVTSTLGQAAKFALCKGLKTLLHHQSSDLQASKLSWPQLLRTDSVVRIPLYLDNLSDFCNTVVPTTEEIALLLPELYRNLLSSSKDLRESSLRLLDTLHKKTVGNILEAVRVATMIEDTPLDLNSGRNLSMHMRQLTVLYKNNEDDAWTSQIIPHYLFGILTFRLSSAWTNAVEALHAICESSQGEAIVSALAFVRLAYDGREDSKEVPEGAPDDHLQVNEYGCTNLELLKRKLGKSAHEINHSLNQLQYRFESAHAAASVESRESRTQALRVFKGIPWLAEKRSRQFVPYLLQWFSRERKTVDSENFVLDADEADDVAFNHATRQDKKALLEIFGAFKNPRVLYKTEDVRTILLDALTNGDSEVQKLSLKALFTWKLSGIKPYEENLTNLIDDARFREELTIFVQTDNEGGLQVEHKPDLMPVLLRLLYGKATARTSSSSTSQSARRKAVFDGLAKMANEDIAQFVYIALGISQRLESERDGDQNLHPLMLTSFTPRQKYGLVNMLVDLVNSFGNRIDFLTSILVPCTLKLLGGLAEPTSDSQLKHEDPKLSVYRDIRQAGIRCITIMYSRCSPTQMHRYNTEVFEAVMSPRIEKLAIETAQGVSGVLKLSSTWALSPDYAHCIFDIDPRLLYSLADILNVASAKDEVKLFVLKDVLKPLVVTTRNKHSDDAASTILQPHLDHVLRCAGDLLDKSPSKIVLVAAIELVSSIAPVAKNSSQVGRLLTMASFLLDQPTTRVHLKAKGELLLIVEHLIQSADLSINDEVFGRIFKSTSSMFKYLRDRTGRSRLCLVLTALSKLDSGLIQVATICTELNAFSARTVDTPDFELRLKAYNNVNEILYKDLSERQWMPILYNLLHFVRDDEELSIRSSASFGLQRFIEASALGSADAKSPSWMLVNDVLLPSLKDGSAERSELVRSEYLAVMAQLVRIYPKWDKVDDMTTLLVNDDDEASFFSNVLHIQQHRRLRALRRLADEARGGSLQSSNIAHFLLPVVEHFVFDRAEDDSANNLAAEAILTIGALSAGLEWPQIRAVFRRYTSYVATKPELQKGIIRLMGLLIDSIGHAAGVKEAAISDRANGDEDLATTDRTVPSPHNTSLARTMPRQEKLSQDLTNNMLPSLQSYLHNKDESTVSLRVPVAVSLVKLLKLLPEDALAERLPPVLTDVSHILRSRAQEARDMTRKTLVDIATLIGPRYFGFILKELRSSLARGYQLHVLSYTVHSILVETSDVIRPGDVDYCLPQLVSIIMDDIFGATGQEKDAEEYVSKMKEVKSSKSFDSMELLAKTSSITSISSLVRPVQALLDERIDLRTSKKADELLRRMGAGLLRNDAIDSRETLVFCYEVVQRKYNRAKEKKPAEADARTKRFLVNARGRRFGPSRQSTSSFSFKLIKFSFDLLRMVLHKYDKLKTSSNIAGFIPMLGDALLEAHEEVQTSALRLIAEIIHVDAQGLEDNAPTYVSEAVKIVKNAVSTNTELSQAALKLIASVLRERTTTTVKDADIAYLLKKLRPDLEEPDRQGVTFNFLRAVLSRKVMVPEVYETLDLVAAMMITSQAKTTRDMARGVYFQFLLNYPLGKSRLSKQINFLAKNIDYKHVEGRQSVMEAMHHLMSKVPRELMQDISGVLFVPLVLATVNDDSPDCRKMAGALLKSMYENCDDEQAQMMVSMTRTWVTQSEQPLLTRAALQLYSSFLEVGAVRIEDEVELLQTRLRNILITSTKNVSSAEWELVYYALQLECKLAETYPKSALVPSMGPMWTAVRECSYYPHAWVKFAAAKLQGLRFADVAKTNAKLEVVPRPLQGSQGLTLEDTEMFLMAKGFFRALRTSGIGEDLATQLARNLIFLGRFSPVESVTAINDEIVEDDADADADDSEIEVEDDGRQIKLSLKYMFERSSAIIRSELADNRAPALVSKTTALQICAALCSSLPASRLQPCIQTLLLPLLQLTDPTLSTPFSTDDAFHTAWKSLITMGQEILGILQKKLGTTQYVKDVSEVQKGIRERREARRTKRRLDAVTAPEKLVKEKKRKIERQKSRKKEQAAEFRGRRRGW
jgi:U3 small nucleolar RNA-associated protein 20